MATGILLGIVVAVTSAITAGQQHAYEAHRRIAATLAAEELMGRLVAAPYDTLITWNGYTENVGKMRDLHNQPLPESFDMVGRDVVVVTSLEDFDDLGVHVQGRTVQVRAFGADGRTLAQLTRFIPEPMS
ncbi:MAG: hypothetical protein JSV91_01520 [Phycisphaerales bacterium]|nr:MAG: hypothetical protein JSV91_01520 [Phycisphaerales bacterium]